VLIQTDINVCLQELVTEFILQHIRVIVIGQWRRSGWRCWWEYSSGSPVQPCSRKVCVAEHNTAFHMWVFILGDTMFSCHWKPCRFSEAHTDV